VKKFAGEVCIMKLRIKGNSVRLRLGQSEVQRLASAGMVEESTRFGLSKEHRFAYALCVTLGEHCVTASFTDRRMLVRVPIRVIHQWITSDQVSIHAIQGIGHDGELRILIEKDFECLHSLVESIADAYPNLKNVAQ